MFVARRLVSGVDAEAEGAEMGVVGAQGAEVGEGGGVGADAEDAGLELLVALECVDDGLGCPGGCGVGQAVDEGSEGEGGEEGEEVC